MCVYGFVLLLGCCVCTIRKGCGPASSLLSLGSSGHWTADGSSVLTAPWPTSKPLGPTQKVMYALAGNDEFDLWGEIATYEEVARLLPDPTCPRPIVLVGPPGVGRNELKRRLIGLDPDKFRTTIPCK